MGTTSASPAALDDLRSSLDRWGETVAYQRNRLILTRKTIDQGAEFSALNGHILTLGLSVGRTAEEFRVADRASRNLALRKTPNVLKPHSERVASSPVAKPQGWQEAIARQRVAAADRQSKAALRSALRTSAKRRTTQLTALLADPSATYLRAVGTGDGRVVQVFGDLISAQHIIVFVPGMDNELNDYRSSLQQRAQFVLSEMKRQAGAGVPVAVVAWLGYDTPDYTPGGLLTQAGTSGKARAGAKALNDDMATIRQQNPSAHITVLAHSYGTVVLGEAMRRGLKASDAIAVGSPGMNTTSRHKLLSPTVTFWASKSKKSAWSINSVPIVTIPVDPISVLPTHGEDPSAKGFGAKRFSSGDSIGHSDYFRPGTAALRNIVAIGLGRVPTFTPTPGPKANSPAKPRRKPSWAGWIVPIVATV